ncbi:MazG-like nucleotide pyrophosphohydrolase [Gordonia phage GodonK]|uniref:MazG-like nucleotide pyrophosphohydrolase n=1 Tax=Gordonia phage GodonK TaxID=2562192 RepID=A0A4D6E2J6_9CAUD|nr:dUTPase [Gordonia phage GodonK]QBZ72731.1 MazG-like nucleotide pyrophosphohydrolase [Gordonia phage GodonK]
MVEALDEVNWKPWSKDEPGEVNKAKFIGEMVDVNHFVANALLAAGATDEEYWDAYAEKVERNRARQASGYSANNNRCNGCRRELDRPGAYTWMSQRAMHSDDGSMYMHHVIACSSCGKTKELELGLDEKLPGQ